MVCFNPLKPLRSSSMNLAYPASLPLPGLFLLPGSPFQPLLSEGFLHRFRGSACPQGFLFPLPPGWIISSLWTPPLHSSCCGMTRMFLCLCLPLLLSGAGHSTGHRLNKCFLREIKNSLPMSLTIVCRKTKFKDDINNSSDWLRSSDVSATMTSPSFHPHQKSFTHLKYCLHFIMRQSEVKAG